MKVCRGQLNAIDEDAYLDLWYKWLMHTSEKVLQLFSKQSLIPMAKGKLSYPCDCCLFGNLHRVSFHKNSTRMLEKLELLYSNVCKPMKVDFLGGNRHFVMFIDDSSWKT